MDNQENKFSIQSPLVESTWTEHDHWLFVNAVANLPENVEGRWQKVSDAIPGKTVDEVKAYHDFWEHKLTQIETGCDELPRLSDNEDGAEPVVCSDSALKTNHVPTTTAAARHEVKERKKGIPWTVEEHRRFLEGLKVYGKGDWRSISRLVVVTRTATQVASHAQKFFLRQKAEKKQKKRSSIHDITISEVETNMGVHAQPTLSTPPPPPTPPAVGRERGVLPTPPTSSPPNFHNGQGREAQPSVAPESTLKPTMLNFYDREGSGAQSALGPTPISCYSCEGGASSLPPSSLFWEGQGYKPTKQTIVHFYDENREATSSLMGNQFQNLIYYPY
ncbi:hypothetical protein QVD17_30068 [Tagetes erecta]|uniref:Uncharacterized protein n=1 Tax=Tagetes erecta TaxID=13708 RepID=A0AAD8K0V2_TARER|nr:hypothetical protein QVD17_30068 [Tagetes erecta]